MRVYRITAMMYAADPLNGVGASLSGARWNSRGLRMAYTGSSRSLVTLEMLVHTGRDSVPTDRVMIPIDIPDVDVKTLAAPFPAGWNELPYDARIQAIGDEFIRGGLRLGFRVPSAVVADEWNVLVNPVHRDFGKIVIHPPEPLVLDPRLFGNK